MFESLCRFNVLCVTKIPKEEGRSWSEYGHLPMTGRATLALALSKDDTLAEPKWVIQLQGKEYEIIKPMRGVTGNVVAFLVKVDDPLYKSWKLYTDILLPGGNLEAAKREIDQRQFQRRLFF